MVNKDTVTRLTAERLRMALAERGKSVRWLSQKSGTPYSTLWRQVNGLYPMQLTELAVYSELLRIDPSEIYPGKNKKPSVAAEGDETERN